MALGSQRRRPHSRLQHGCQVASTCLLGLLVARPLPACRGRVSEFRVAGRCSKIVVVPCSKRCKSDDNRVNRRAGKRLKNQVE